MDKVLPEEIMANRGGNSIVLDSFGGLNNMMTPESRGIKYLDDAVNVVIDDSGKLRVRKGCEQVITGDIHSLFNAGDTLYYRMGTALYSMSLLTAAPVILRNDMTGSARTWYAMVTGKTFYSDGVSTGVIETGVSHGWGIQPPTTITVSQYPGALPEGECFVTYTYVRSDGLESGIRKPIAGIAVPDQGGFSVAYSASTDPHVTHIRIYATRPNGDLLFFVAEVSNGNGTYHYQGAGREFHRPCLTTNLSPAPTGSIVEYHKGRIYIASHDVIWYSNKTQYEHFEVENGFIQMDDAITVLASVPSGLYVATASGIWSLAGDDVPATATKVANYGAVHGTQATSMEGVVYFVSHSGVCSIDTAGQFKNITKDTYGFATSSIAGTGAFVKNDGIENYIFSLYETDINPSNIYQYLTYANMKIRVNEEE